MTCLYIIANELDPVASLYTRMHVPDRGASGQTRALIIKAGLARRIGLAQCRPKWTLRPELGRHECTCTCIAGLSRLAYMMMARKVRDGRSSSTRSSYYPFYLRMGHEWS